MQSQIGLVLDTLLFFNSKINRRIRRIKKENVDICKELLKRKIVGIKSKNLIFTEIKNIFKLYSLYRILEFPFTLFYFIL